MMLSFYNIWTVAKFEIKTLSRSWFLRIFAILSIALLFLFDLMIFTNVSGGFIPRFFYGMSASIPYANLMLFNLAQAIITVFLASDFLKRDKKLDTTEAIYIRSITNSDYVLGKALAIIVIFLVLNMIVLLMGAIFNIVNPDIQTNLLVYLYYFILISLPTLIFIIGLSFLVMTLIPNQAVTFIILLGYIATTLFYLGWNFYHSFDYTAFFIPFMYSDFYGFGNLDALLLQRMAYLFIGVGFIFITMYMFKRLPQSDAARKVSVIFAGLFIVGGISLLFLYVNNIYSGQELRAQMIEANTSHLNDPAISVISNNLTFDHMGSTIKCQSEMELQNNSDEPVEKIILSLNPGLNVDKLVSGDSQLQFKREAHLIVVSMQSPLPVGEIFNLDMDYSGTIVDAASYIDINDDLRKRLNKAFYTFDKTYSIISPEYVLLTSENLWYPQPGITFTPRAQFNDNDGFTHFKLTVNTNQNLTALSQGKVSNPTDGKYVFDPETPLPKISIAIGDYIKKEVVVDSISYNLYTNKSHNYYEQYFNELGDTLSILIKELKQDYERELDLEYPYKRLSLVEVPIQFNSYARIWTSAQERTQPEFVFIPENGVTMDEADFKQRTNMQERFGNRSNQVILPRENQSNLFKTFVRNSFLNGSSSFRFRGGPQPDENPANPYKLFPNYYAYTNNVSSTKLPLFNTVLENYLNIESESSSPFMRAILGLNPDERSVQVLYENTLEKIISDTTNNKYLKTILRLKGNYLFTSLEYKIGKENLRNTIKSVLNNNKYSSHGYEEFKQELLSKYGINFELVVSDWYKSSELPAYYISKVEGYKIIDGDRERYQVNLNLTNPEPVDGFVKLTFEAQRGGQGGGGRFMRMFGGGGEETSLAEKLIYIEPAQTKLISTVLDEAPGRLTLNTLISRNLPLTQDFSFDEFEENKKMLPSDGEKALDLMEPFNTPGEIVVDNEDSGFEIFNPEQSSFLKRIFNLGLDDEKYIGLRMWNSPDNWRATVISEAYGKYIHSAHYTEAGNGSIKVAWNTNLEESGSYDVYAYLSKPRIPGRGQDRNEEYHYTVFSDDGEEEVVLDFQNVDAGWNLLGNYYLSAGTTKVELSNKSDNGLIIADAVKWVKRK